MKIFLFLVLLFLPYSYVQAQMGFNINNHADYTNSREVKLYLGNAAAIAVKVGNDFYLKEAGWQEYHPITPHTLAEGEGSKEVYVQFMYPDSSITETYSDNIILDTTPPTITNVRVGSGNFTKNRVGIDLYIEVPKEDEVEQVRISNTDNFTLANWVPLRNVHRWSLSAGDGNKTVYVQVHDRAGNISETATREVVYDSEYPLNGGITIAKENITLDTVGNMRFINQNNQVVDLEISAEGAHYMMISNEPTFFGSKWQYFDEFFIGWRLDSDADGPHEVYVRFMDQAKNISPSYSDRVYIDSKPPLDGSLQLSNGREVSHTNEVPLSLFARGASFMKVSNTRFLDDVEWERYSRSKQWTLKPGDGVRYVHAMFKDAAGNLSSVYSDSITVDGIPPTSPKVVINDGLEATDNPTLEVTATAEGAAWVQFSPVNEFSGASWRYYIPGETYLYRHNSKGGEKEIFARFRDTAGNVSDTVRTSIFLEIYPSHPSLLIDKGAAFTIDKAYKVQLQLYARNATEVMVSNNESFAGAKWLPYTERMAWQLEPRQGVQTVYVKYRSSTKTESIVVQDDIEVDNIAPAKLRLILSHAVTSQRLNPYQVNVQLIAEGAKKMRYGVSPELIGAQWVSYTDLSFKFVFPQQEPGEKTFYAQLRDEAGNITDVLSQSILINPIEVARNPVEINYGNPTTTENEVNVRFNAESVEYYRINHLHSLEDIAWQRYQDSIKWVLPETDGRHMLYVQFKDPTGEVISLRPQSIYVDREVPENPHIAFKQDVLTRKDARVEVQLSADGASKMMLSESENFTDAAWQSYRPHLIWRFNGEDGVKQLYAKFADDSGNESHSVFATVYLDRTGPTQPAIVINDSARITKSRQVQLNLSAEGIKAGTGEMIISNNGYFGYPSGWEPYATTKVWELPAANGRTTVYVKFKDQYHNESAVAKDYILLDTEPPVIFKFEAEGEETMVEGLEVTLTSKVSDAKEMRIANSADMAGSSWEPYAAEKTWMLAGYGLQGVWLQLKDAAGNECKPYRAEIMVYQPQ
jgi:hypothetical protein